MNARPPFAVLSVADIPDEELLRRAVMSCKARFGQRKHSRWTRVMDRFSLGSTYSAQLCHRFNLDPEEQV
jgi:hypothetical protein